ncbi:hypothetical protein ACFFK0_11790 [Paenibacillus chartarius]|uniref:VCBS repeat-containing protein n=1 Tax=Paenibacillus chartarius TaxID=747481 RepID=A0ABV6DKE6_9BACL
MNMARRLIGIAAAVLLLVGSVTAWVYGRGAARGEGELSRGEAASVSEPIPAASTQELQRSVKLAFAPVEMEVISKGAALDNVPAGYPQKNVSLGSIDGTDSTLELYDAAEEPGRLTAVLRFGGESYAIPEVSSSDVWLPPSGLSVHSASGLQSIAAGLELFANGPGFKVYLVYDFGERKWLRFEEWGTPYAADLDRDGRAELAIQFEGLHMHFPDVIVYRWSGDVLQRSASASASIWGAEHKAYARLGEDGRIASGIVDEERPERTFLYFGGELVPQP